MGKFCNAPLSQLGKWLAVTTVIEPAVMYPLLNTYFTEQEFRPISSILSQLKCSALGLNRNFPWCTLYGPTALGGLGIPSPTQKNTKDRINYFLFNICNKKSTNTQKLQISMIYTQLETGLFWQFFSTSYHQFGHHVIHSTCVQLWMKTEPFGLSLKWLQERLGSPIRFMKAIPP